MACTTDPEFSEHSAGHRLCESVARSAVRQSASELARKVQRCPVLGELRGLSARDCKRVTQRVNTSGWSRRWGLHAGRLRELCTRFLFACIAGAKVRTRWV